MMMMMMMIMMMMVTTKMKIIKMVKSNLMSNLTMTASMCFLVYSEHLTQEDVTLL